MTHSEKNAIQVVSTVLVISIGLLIVDYNFISVQMWSSLEPQEMVRWSLLGTLVLGVTYYASRLIPQNRVLQFSWLKLIPGLKRYAENMAVLPTYLFAPVAVAYMLMLTYALPIITFWEEWYFRGRIDGWISAVVTTIAFALVHFAIGASLGGSLVLVIPGGFFALVYTLQSNYAEGLIASTDLHVFYDVVAIILVSCIVARQRRHLKPQPAGRAGLEQRAPRPPSLVIRKD